MTISENVVKVAASYVGTREPLGDDVFIRWYNQKTGAKFGTDTPWCCIFASYCFDKAGAGGLVGPYASCTALMNDYNKKGQWKARGYIPRPGDLILYDWDLSGDADHIGIVEKVSGSTITVIEGNKNNAYGNGVDGVARRTVDANNPYIRGFITPAYPVAGSGDVNGDGAVTATDAQLTLKATVGKANLTAAQKAAADINADGQVTASDALGILKKVVKK